MTRTMARQLIGKVAMITGASRGIGKGIAESLAAAVATVVLADIDFETAEKVAAQIQKESNAQSVAVRLDVSSAESVNAGTKRVVELFGRVGILVSNAWVYQ